MLLLLLALTLAAHRNQFVDIAGFGTGAGIAAILAVVLGGGTTLTYAVGAEEERDAVRAVRYRFVLPLLLGGVVVTTAVAVGITELQWWSIAAGGAYVALNNLSELGNVVLNRHLRTLSGSIALTISRLVPASLIVLGLPYSLAMSVSGAVYLIMLTMLIRNLEPKSSIKRFHLGLLRKAFRPEFLATAFAEAVNARLLFIAAPMLMSADVSGQLSTSLTTTQAVTAVILAPLMTVMSLESRSGSEPWMARVRMLVRSSAFVVAILGWFASDVVVEMLNLNAGRAAASWSVLLTAACLAVTTRSFQYAMMAAGRRQVASGVAVSAACGTAIGLVICLTTGIPLAFAALIGEGFAAIYLIVVRAGGLHRPAARGL